MRSPELAADYVRRAKARLAAVDALYAGAGWADVVRESQEVVELALKGLLRSVGIEPPRIHDVSDVLLAERERFPKALQRNLERLAAGSRTLRATGNSPSTERKISRPRASTRRTTPPRLVRLPAQRWRPSSRTSKGQSKLWEFLGKDLSSNAGSEADKPVEIIVPLRRPAGKGNRS